MSSRRRSGRIEPRHWTEEQIQFVLDRINTHSNPQIATAFNRYFAGVTVINEKQVKYIRTNYGRDPNWG